MSSSWLSLSLPNPFLSPADDHSPPPSPPPPSHAAGELSGLTQSFTRQLRGVASFLALPPKQHSDQPPTPSSSSQTLTGIKNDLAEIGDSFKSSLSLLSSNKAVTKISRFASNMLQFENRIDGEEEEEGEDVLGITDEVIDFVREISLRPELWTEFPSSVNKDFDMSDVQKDHVSTIEHMVPSLTALRRKIESCISKEQFWIIHFILLLPRLNDDDSELLSAPEIVEVRETLLQKLNSKHNTPVEVSGEHKSRNMAETGTDISNTQKMNPPSSSSKHLSDNLNAPERILTQDHEDSEPSSSEEYVNIGTYGNTRNKQTENEDDISFSGLEDEDNDLSSRMSGSKVRSSPSQSGSIEWVQLKENSQNLGWLQKDRQSTDREKDSGSEDSNEWFTVDKIDSD